RTLFRRTGGGNGINADLPVAGENLASWPAGWGRPTLILRLDPIGDSAARLALPASAELDLDHPSILALAERANAARDAARAAEGGHGPSVSLAGRISRDYPNGPIHETITQKTASASASWSVFEFGRVKNEAASYREQAAAGEALRDDRIAALKADWSTAKDRLRGLWSEQAINKASLDESAELAKITYRAYLNGGANHVQVETANLGELEARVTFAQTEAEIAVELAILNSLAKATEELAFNFDR
ncbi:MAG: TolC family protein, partial [Elusimicrobia bacterium]|nr:TolC family protein [Elusimicrobiota bacterium]